MPKFVRPAEGDYAEDPINALGNPLRANIIGYVRRHGPSTRGQIADALEVGYPSVAKALQVLVRTGVLVTDPKNPTQGQRVLYTVDDSVVTEMWIKLGQAIGEV